MPAIVETLTPVEKKDNANAPTAKPLVGIIYPPPEVRNIVDKTASFVARNGPEFEARIRQNEINNPKFNFLNPGDPYHAYYQHKVKEFKDGKANEPFGPVPQLLAPPQQQQKQQLVTPIAIQQKQQEAFKQVTEQPIVPKEPPPEYEFFADPPSISAFDLDVVKLTAQFVARNGRQFLTNIMNREQRNYQFDFLRPQHSLFQYFTKLLEQYTKVLIPPKDLMKKLKDESTKQQAVLSQVKYRVEWIKHQEAQKKREEEEAEKERISYAQIDWHDFVVVETVDYQPFEQGNFPPPTNPDEVGARVLMQERLEDGEEVEMQIESEEEEEEEEEEEGKEEEEVSKEARDNTQVQDMEEESSSEEEDEEEEEEEEEQKEEVQPPRESVKEQQQEKPPAPVPPLPKETPQPPPLPPMPDQVVIKKGYDPKAAVKVTRAPGPDEYLISPITGEKIPASKVQEHMRIGLLDPRWVEQRDRHLQEKINQDTVYAQGSAIESSLKQLAERRTDIFGVGDEETAIGKKIGEEDKKKEEKVTWDGHTSSMEAATRAARANITLEEQIHQIHKVKGLLPDEEKEKIGPKPTSRPPVIQTQQPKPPQAPPPPKPAPPPQAPPPKPAPPPPPKSTVSQPTSSVMTPVTPRPPPPPAPPMTNPMPPLPPMQPRGLLPPQPPGMMMVPPMSLRPRPPMMALPARPPFQVAAPRPPGVGFMRTPSPPQPPPMVPKHLHTVDTSEDSEPPSKKQRTEENLIAEGEFMAKSKSPVTLKVLVPKINEKPEWKLKGQILTVTLPLTDTISVLKAKLHEEVGMPPGKQKLQWEGLFFKDSNSLAYYNITPGAMINLQLKERGGRKK